MDIALPTKDSERAREEIRLKLEAVGQGAQAIDSFSTAWFQAVSGQVEGEVKMVVKLRYEVYSEKSRGGTGLRVDGVGYPVTGTPWEDLNDAKAQCIDLSEPNDTMRVLDLVTRKVVYQYP